MATLSVPSGATIDNDGAAIDITVTLPAWQSGLIFSFVTVNAHAITVLCAGTDKIGLSAVQYASLTSTEEFSYLSLEATNLSGIWIVRSMGGGWSG